MEALVPSGTTCDQKYTTVAALVKYFDVMTMQKTATVLGFVQVRAISGGIYASKVRANWETGKVFVTGWPLQLGTGGQT
jgi:hypothetical protein